MADMNVTNMGVSLETPCFVPCSPVMTESLEPKLTFAACLQGLNAADDVNVNPEIVKAAVSDEIPIKLTEFAEELAEFTKIESELEIVLENKPKEAEVHPSLGHLLFHFERISEKAEELGGVDKLTWEDWRVLFIVGEIKLSYSGEGLPNVKKEFDDFVSDIIEIFKAFIRYSDGEINEHEKFEIISEILSRRAHEQKAVQENAGTEGGGVFDRQILELIMQFLEKIDPTAGWKNWSEASATKGGDKPVVMSFQVGVMGINVTKVTQTFSETAQIETTQTKSESYVPNVQGEIVIPKQNISELPKAELPTTESPKAEKLQGQKGQIKSEQNASELPKAVQQENYKAEYGQKSVKAQSYTDESGFKGIPESISKDVTEYKVSGFTAENQADGYKVTQAQSAQAEIMQLKEESAAYQRPVIVSEITVEGIDGLEFSETAESVKPAENSQVVQASEHAQSIIPEYANTVGGQKIALQVSSSIIENLEKIISQAAQTSQTVEVASVKAIAAPVKAEIAKPVEFQITLNPEHLGKVTVKLVTLEQAQGNVKVSVQIIAASEQVRDVLMARASAVRVMIEMSGATVERYEVVTSQENRAISSAEGTQRDILDDENSKNQQENRESQQEPEQSESEQVQISFAELMQAMV
jgi:hypothetical protein